MSKRQAAVTVRNLRLSYDGGKTYQLDDICMTVPMAGIYGLLGASGCGKTSLLRCVVGLQRPNKGVVRIFGKKLNTGLVPGPGVGFMPQETALYDSFTISENLVFFGQLQGMPAKLIEIRMAFLCTLFELTPASRFVGKLSGGQQKRVSLAVALIHEPPFLIVDEPTVGLDPVLRERIWRYFVNVQRTEHTTILVTTHFIEEIERASVVGVMKDGKLWCERSPHELKHIYKKSSLSEAYLSICMALAEPSEESIMPREAPRDDVASAPFPTRLSASVEHNQRFAGKATRIRALVVKNLTKMFRRFITGLFQIVVPACVGVIFCLFIGGSPYDLVVGVVNEDQHSLLSLQFVQQLDTKTVTLVQYVNLADAFSAVRDQQIWAVIHFKDGFQRAMLRKYLALFTHNITREDVEETGVIEVYMDSTDFQIRGTLLSTMLQAYKSILNQLTLTEFNFTFQAIRFTDPFYHGFDLTFREFMGPGVIIALIFAMSLSLTAIVLVHEVREGLQGRCQVSGFLASALSSDETTALLTSLTALYLALLVGGIIWPLQSIPKIMQTLSELVPQTLPVRAMRGVMIRDYGAGDRHVLRGLASSLIWGVIFFALSIFIFARKKA
ncbi:ABC transporter G family member 23-like isoform X2 [Ornithodoros turicata]|uniref:ABC transporter G family member 23-like isoform X2 n=1 Tax=Ornithodoros turicata TaxID=34597 RepID=UPI00313A1B45